MTAVSRWRRGRWRRPGAGEAAGGAAPPPPPQPPHGTDDLLCQIVGRLKILQTSVDSLEVSVDSLGSCIHTGQALGQWPGPFGGECQTDREELMEADLEGVPEEEREPERELHGRAGLPPCPVEARAPCPERLEETCSEMSEDVINPMPLSYLAPYTSLSTSFCGTPFAGHSAHGGSADEQLLRDALPKLEALQVEASTADTTGEELGEPPASAPPGRRSAPRRRPAQRGGSLPAGPAAEGARAGELARRARSTGLLLSMAWEMMRSPHVDVAAWSRWWLLPPFARASRDWAVAAACERLEHGSESVRRRAMSLVIGMEAKGSQLAREHAFARLSHSDPGVRLVALEAYARLTARTEVGVQSRTAQYHICKRLGDSDKAVRDQAVASLRRMVDLGDEFIVTELLDHVTHQDLGVKCTALEALNEIAEKGDGAVIEHLVPLACKDPAPCVRALAQMVLSNVVEAVDVTAANAAMKFIEDADPDVACTALQQIGLWAGKDVNLLPGDPHLRLVQAVAECLLGQRHHRVKQVAAQVLQDICGTGHDYAVTVLIDYLKDEAADTDTKLAVLNAFGDLGERGDEACIGAVRRLEDDPDPQLRQMVTGVLLLLR